MLQQVTDATGHYTFSGLALGSYQVYLAIGDNQPPSQATITDRDGNPITVDLQLAPVARIHGQLTDAQGTAITDGVVGLYQSGQLITYVTADATGNYALVLLQPGTFDLIATSDQASFDPSAAVVVQSSDSLVVNFHSGIGTLVATITDSQIAVAGATATLVRTGTVGGDVESSIGTIASDGTVMFSNLVAGNYRIDVMLSGGDRGSTSLTISAPGTTSRTVILSQTATLNGVVRDSSGFALAGAIVILQLASDPTIQLSVQTADDGTYSLTGITPGTYDVTALADGYAASTQTGVPILTTASVNATLSTSNTAIDGALVDQHGNPVHGGGVALQDSAGHVIGFASVGTDGTFTITTASGTGLKLTVSAQGCVSPAASTIDVPAGASTHVGAIALQAVAVNVASAQTTPTASNALSMSGISANSVKPAFLGLPSWLTDSIFSLERTANDVQMGQVPALGDCTDCAADLENVTIKVKIENGWYSAGEDDQAALRLSVLGTGIEIVTDAAAVGGFVGKWILAGYTLTDKFALAAVTQPRKILAIANTIQDIIQFGLQAKGLISDVSSASSAEDASEKASKAGDVVSFVLKLFDKAHQLIVELAHDATAKAFFEKEGALFGVLEVFADLYGDIQGAKTRLDQLSEAIHVVSDSESSFQSDVKRYKSAAADAYSALQSYKECLNACEREKDPPPEPPTQPIPPPSQQPGNPFYPYDPNNPFPGGDCQVPTGAFKDPNNIIGPAGVGDDHYVSTSDPFGYTIQFENEPTATLPTPSVTITQQLDANLDWRSFRLGTFGWGGNIFTVPDNSSFYQTRADLTATKGYFVDVTATIDVRTGIATWTFATIDPATGEQPTDPTIGFLPPDDADGIGEGFVSYTIAASASAPTGTVVNAKATITFDTNPPLDTPTIFNTLDRGTGLSTSVNELPSSQSSNSFGVSWLGVDDAFGSAVKSFTIYVSDNNGAYRPWLTNSTLTAATYVGAFGHTYRFYSVGQDNVGNIEVAPTVADAQTTVQAIIASVVGRQIFYNNSSFDGGDPAANTADTGAIAADKQALLPGQSATFVNYTSYSRGINGIMIDVSNLENPAALNASDFTFLVGNSNDPSTWTVAPAPSSISVRIGEGVGGADRITLLWSDNAIQNEWLQVTMLASDHTGLTSPDVFYFGNAIGESGNSPTDAAVTAADALAARGRISASTSVAIDNHWDYNRDGLITSADMQAAQQHYTAGDAVLILFAAPALPATPSAIQQAQPSSVSTAPAPIDPIVSSTPVPTATPVVRISDPSQPEIDPPNAVVPIDAPPSIPLLVEVTTIAVPQPAPQPLNEAPPIVAIPPVVVVSPPPILLKESVENPSVEPATQPAFPIVPVVATTSPQHAPPIVTPVSSPTVPGATIVAAQTTPVRALAIPNPPAVKVGPSVVPPVNPTNKPLVQPATQTAPKVVSSVVRQISTKDVVTTQPLPAGGKIEPPTSPHAPIVVLAPVLSIPPLSVAAPAPVTAEKKPASPLPIVSGMFVNEISQKAPPTPANLIPVQIVQAAESRPTAPPVALKASLPATPLLARAVDQALAVGIEALSTEISHSLEELAAGLLYSGLPANKLIAKGGKLLK